MRRLVIRREDLRLARAWIVERLSLRRLRGTGEVKVFNQLFAARDRARVRQRRSPAAEEATRQPLVEAPPEEPAPRPGIVEKPLSQEEALARLRSAKKRARDKS